MSRELTDEYHDAWIDAYRWVDGHRVAVCLPVTCQDLGRVVGGDCADDEWFPRHAAPGRCFKPAEPDDALEAGERVYVSNPAGLLAACRIEGWGEIQGVSKDTATVLFDQAWTGHADPHRTWHVLLAACHRVGPQSEPPEGGVFLGRIHYYDQGLRDAWWSKGRFYFEGGSKAGVEIRCVSPRDCYAAALAVAGKLGLVEAEPERAEPKFQVGQYLADNTVSGVRGRVEGVKWDEAQEQWYYTFVRQTWYISELDLHPHTMTIADVPDEVLVAILRKRPMRVVDVPVGCYGRPADSSELVPEHAAKEKTLTPTCTDQRGDKFVVYVNGLSAPVWPWNLRLAKKADPEEERAPS